MDPETAWHDLATAIAADDWDRAGEFAEELSRWLGSGGFPPCVTGHREFDLIVVQATCRAIAAWEVV